MAWLELKVPPPAVGALAAAGMWVISRFGPQFVLPDEGRHAVTGILVAAGLVFDLLGILAFHSSRTTINPLKPERSSVLVKDGVYRLTRNPMYVGMSLILMAWAVHLSALLPFAGPAVFAAYITRFQIIPEERILRQLFGQEYIAFAARVRRWL